MTEDFTVSLFKKFVYFFSFMIYYKRYLADQSLFCLLLLHLLKKCKVSC